MASQYCFIISDSCGTISDSCGTISITCGITSRGCGSISGSCGIISRSCGMISVGCGRVELTFLGNGDFGWGGFKKNSKVGRLWRAGSLITIFKRKNSNERELLRFLTSRSCT